MLGAVLGDEGMKRAINVSDVMLWKSYHLIKGNMSISVRFAKHNNKKRIFLFILYSYSHIVSEQGKFYRG